MFVVYWLEVNASKGLARFERFDSTALVEALRFAETLRKRQIDVAFVTLCSENPQSVGRAGVAESDADYD